VTYATVVGEFLGWTTFFGIGIVGLCSIGLATVRTYQALKLRAWSELALGWTVLGTFVLLGLGGWLIVDAVWAARRVGRLVRLVRA
jgi:hypothetical protein